MDAEAQFEWDALAAEHARLLAELRRLRRQAPERGEARREPFDRAAHEALRAELVEHEERIADFRRRYVIPPPNPDSAA